MSDEKNRSYVEVVRDEVQQYTQGLMRENEKLRALTTTLESDNRRLSESLDFATLELDRLRSHFAGVEQENEKYAAQYHQIEIQSSNLSNLYVASYQLHSAVDRTTVLNTIQEIVINLIGSEEVAIFEHHAEVDEFRLSASFGVDKARLESFKPGNGPIGRRLAGGELFVDEAVSSHEEKLTACVPLKIGDEIIGAILVFRLLEHKGSLQPVDHELFELLAVHASTALYCATLHETRPIAAVR